MRNFPLPLEVAEMKIHPSLERVNLNELPDLEMSATSSSSETRLFRFFCPENRTVPSPRADAQTQVDNNSTPIRVTNRPGSAGPGVMAGTPREVNQSRNTRS